MVKKKFARYVSQNILGMVGISAYILADTYFISKAVGADGITALNLVLPVYGLIFAFGQMIGVGSAIRFAVAKGQQSKEQKDYFGNALFWGTVVGLLFIMLGIFSPDGLLRILGADQRIVEVGLTYTRIFLCFAPCFTWNYICNAFVRNDGNPTIAMTATICSSLFNIVFDYVLMFPLGMGMPGAALATALSPLLGVGICMLHLCSKKSTVSWKMRISFSKLLLCARLGVSAFVGEFSSAIITMTFNFLILGLAGNMGVAAYGVIANTALVGAAIFSGLAQGVQPLASESHGKGAKKEVRELVLLAFATSLALALCLYLGVYFGAEEITAIFNRDALPELTAYAVSGIRLYFIGFFFSGINVAGAIILSGVERAKEAFFISVARGFVLILLFAFLLARLFGMTGVWLAFPVTEGVTMLLTLGFLWKERNLEIKEI